MERIIQIPQDDNVIHCRMQSRLRATEWALRNAETAVTQALIDLMEHEIDVCKRLGVNWPAAFDDAFLNIAVVEGGEV